ncbi:MAG: type II secretion system F family protein, partial [Pseudonocardiaceae bacterium]
HPVEVSEAALGESRRPASRRDLAVVFRSLAALVEAGVPLERAVSSSEGLARGALLSCLAGARQRLREGKSLAQALDSDRGTVPGLVLGMLRAGERAGRLPATLEQVATHLELEAELLSRVRHALAYPALLTIAGLVSVVVIGAVVVPKFAALLGEAGQELPPSTRLLLLGSAILTRYWLPLLLWTCVAAWFLAAWLQRPAGRARWHRAPPLDPGRGSHPAWPRHRSGGESPEWRARRRHAAPSGHRSCHGVRRRPAKSAPGSPGPGSGWPEERRSPARWRSSAP